MATKPEDDDEHKDARKTVLGGVLDTPQQTGGTAVAIPKGPPLSGLQKAALIISSLTSDVATTVFRSLPEDEMEMLTMAVFKVQTIPQEVRMRALQEFSAQMNEATGVEMLAKVLENSVGKEKANLILSQLTTSKGQGRGLFEGKFFEFLVDTDPEQILAVLRLERPQTLALIFCHLNPKRAAEILSVFESELQGQVIIRMGRMDRVSPEIVTKVSNVLRRRLSGVQGHLRSTGGPKVIAKVLNHVDRGTEKRIFENLRAADTTLFEDVKKLMLVFEDLVMLPDQAIQAVLREVEMNDITMALKGASSGMKDLIFRNLSSRAAERLREEIELLGPKPRGEVEGAQERVVAVVRRLEEEGKLKLARGKEDELVD